MGVGQVLKRVLNFFLMEIQCNVYDIFLSSCFGYIPWLCKIQIESFNIDWNFTYFCQVPLQGVEEVLTMEVDLGGLGLAEVMTGALQEGDLLQGEPLEGAFSMTLL